MVVTSPCDPYPHWTRVHGIISDKIAQSDAGRGVACMHALLALHLHSCHPFCRLPPFQMELARRCLYACLLHADRVVSWCRAQPYKIQRAWLLPSTPAMLQVLATPASFVSACLMAAYGRAWPWLAVVSPGAWQRGTRPLTHSMPLQLSRQLVCSSTSHESHRGTPAYGTCAAARGSVRLTDQPRPQLMQLMACI